MRLRIGTLNSKGFLGIRCAVLYPLNPFRQLQKAVAEVINFRKTGLILFWRFPGFRIAIVKKRREQNNET